MYIIDIHEVCCLCSVISLTRQGHTGKKFFVTDTHARIDAHICKYIYRYI